MNALALGDEEEADEEEADEEADEEEELLPWYECIPRAVRR